VKKLIVKISEGLGNQLFMYANAYSLSRTLNYDLFIDKVSGYKDDHLSNINPYLLDNFCISANLASINDTSTNKYYYIKNKLKKKFDLFKNKKSYIIEPRNKKTTFITYKDYLKNTTYTNKIFVDGFFQSERYFEKYADEIKNEFKFKNLDESKLAININELKDKSSVSIVVRTNRYNERSIKDLHNENKVNASNQFTKKTIMYIEKAVEFFKKKIVNPKFYVWSNDFTNLRPYFGNEFKFVVNKSNKSISDLYTMSLCSNFIIGPSTFHWWGAYLSNNINKICICPPKELTFSSNLDIYPNSWIKF